MSSETLTDAGLSAEQKAELEVIAASEPDLEEIPELTDAQWQYARRFYRPRKEAISLRIDADILAWLRDRHERYQTEINRILRERMVAELTRK